MAEFFKKHRPADVQQRLDFRVDLPSAGPVRRPREFAPVVPSSPPPVPAQVEGPKYLQIHDSYIVEQTEDGFVIIDD